MHVHVPGGRWTGSVSPLSWIGTHPASTGGWPCSQPRQKNKQIPGSCLDPLFARCSTGDSPRSHSQKHNYEGIFKWNICVGYRPSSC